VGAGVGETPPATFPATFPAFAFAFGSAAAEAELAPGAGALLAARAGVGFGVEVGGFAALGTDPGRRGLFPAAPTFRLWSTVVAFLWWFTGVLVLLQVGVGWVVVVSERAGMGMVEARGGASQLSVLFPPAAAPTSPAFPGSLGLGGSEGAMAVAATRFASGGGAVAGFGVGTGMRSSSEELTSPATWLRAPPVVSASGQKIHINWYLHVLI
jgi:hypothetical protein